MTTPSFLDLPPEVRERILVALHVHDGPISLQRQLAQPEISKVCRLLRTESLGVFYSRNAFGVDNKGGHAESLHELNDSIRAMRDIDISCIRRLRFNWNTGCQANDAACFNTGLLGNDTHSCRLVNVTWRAPVYMVACNILLTTSEPWFELSISFCENPLCSLTAKPLYEEMQEILRPEFAGPLPAGQRRKQLHRYSLVRMVRFWQLLASKMLAANCEHAHLQLQRSGTTVVTNHALQDYQMQLMLLDQQKKKRLLMAKRESDNLAAERC